MSTLWADIAYLVDWLRRANGDSPHQQAMQIMKVGEEIGEAAGAVTVEEEAAELCDVILTAQVALAATWSDNPGQAISRLALERRIAGLTIIDVAAENGRLIQAYIGYVGQNPRKGRTHSREDVAAALWRVAHSAYGVLGAITHNPDVAFAAHVRKTADRVRAMAEGRSAVTA